MPDNPGARHLLKLPAHRSVVLMVAYWSPKPMVSVQVGAGLLNISEMWFIISIIEM